MHKYICTQLHKKVYEKYCKCMQKYIKISYIVFPSLGFSFENWFYSPREPSWNTYDDTKKKQNGIKMQHFKNISFDWLKTK